MEKAKNGQMGFSNGALEGEKNNKEKGHAFWVKFWLVNKRLEIKSKEIPSCCLMIVLREIQFNAHFQ